MLRGANFTRDKPRWEAAEYTPLLSRLLQLVLTSEQPMKADDATLGGAFMRPFESRRAAKWHDSRLRSLFT